MKGIGQRAADMSKKLAGAVFPGTGQRKRPAGLLRYLESAQARGSQVLMQHADRVFPDHVALLRSFPDHDLGARQIEREKSREVFLNRDPAYADEDRPRQVEIDGPLQPEQLGIHAARPQPEVLETPRG